MLFSKYENDIFLPDWWFFVTKFKFMWEFWKFYPNWLSELKISNIEQLVTGFIHKWIILIWQTNRWLILIQMLENSNYDKACYYEYLYHCKPNMSHYRPVLFGINSWRRRSKKSKVADGPKSSEKPFEKQLWKIVEDVFSKMLKSWIFQDFLQGFVILG